MVIDEDLLRQARTLGGRLTDALHQADLAKADYHHAIRRLHSAGASMREVADALDLSHQRVHQIIEAAGGTGGWKVRKTSGELACTFCGLAKDEVAKLIAGPGVYICDGCVTLARQVGAEPVVTSRTRLERVARVSELDCSFCGKVAERVERLVAGPDARICADCLDLCEEVLTAAGSGRPSEQ